MPTLVAVEALGGVGGEAAARLTTTIAHVPRPTYTSLKLSIKPI